MIVMRFVDTNILIYAFTGRTDDQGKAAAAIAVLQSPGIACSVQVLQEFYVQSTRPWRTSPLTADEALGVITKLRRFPVQDTTTELFERAVAAHRRWTISYWDASIIEAARMLGCTQVLSEDLQHDQDFAGVRAVNPFL